MTFVTRNTLLTSTTPTTTTTTTPPTDPTIPPLPPVQPTALSKMTDILKGIKIGDKTADEVLKQAIGAESSDEVIGAIVAGLVQIAIERNGKIKEFDAKLHQNFRKTITETVKNESAQKALLGLADIVGEKVVSNLIAASAGTVTAITIDFLKNDQLKELYKNDPKAFGLEIAKRAGLDLATSFGTALLVGKRDDIFGAIISFFKKLFGRG